MHSNLKGALRKFRALRSRGVETTTATIYRGCRLYKTHGGMKNIRAVWMKTTWGGEKVLEPDTDYKIEYCKKCGYPFATVLNFAPPAKIRDGLGVAFYAGRPRYLRTFDPASSHQGAAHSGVAKIDIQEGVRTYHLQRRMKQVGPIWLMSKRGQRHILSERKNYAVEICRHCGLPHAISLTRKPARNVQEGLWVAFSTQPGRCGTCGGIIL